MSTTTTYRVSGMTCEHCIAAVTAEVGSVTGVTDVEVELASGTVMVRGEGFSDAHVVAAVEEAGYRIADADD